MHEEFGGTGSEHVPEGQIAFAAPAVAEMFANEVEDWPARVAES